MNGAESLVRTLVNEGVDVCFTNPGTSEMHFVAALDRIPGMRCVLGMFEGVVTGAADGYYRIAGKPASTLLHLGPGLGNGLANLHNAKKAGSGIVNIVGEHASYHIKYDAPLTSDIEGVARPMSNWVRTAKNSQTVSTEAAAAISVAREAPGKIATLILPADTAWGPADQVGVAPKTPARRKVAKEMVVAAAKALQSGGSAATLLLGGIAVRGRALELAGRIAAKTGCVLAAEFNCARAERGAGRVQLQRVPYVIEQATKMFAATSDLVLVGSKSPVAFFAYPDKPGLMAPPSCRVTELAAVEEDIEAALEAVATELGALNLGPAHVAELKRSALPTGAITPEGVGAVLGALLPENAIVVDESVTSGRGFAAPTATAPSHDWLGIMGGAIGFGFPCAVGAAVAAPNRKVVALEGDGSGMYTVQALWTMARNSLDVTMLVFANRSYQILRGELAGVGAGEPGKNATDMLTLDRPDLDWVSLAKGHGVEAGRATTLEELAREFKRGIASSGPYLIEVVL
ncbi:MAG TPA: acetolactate synthase large subunit [Steroidobacteraceae bacterium]|nr:acetolactate synthase large subunit [Steroidobacteraceae bacterium]